MNAKLSYLFPFFVFIFFLSWIFPLPICIPFLSCLSEVYSLGFVFILLVFEPIRYMRLTYLFSVLFFFFQPFSVLFFFQPNLYCFLWNTCSSCFLGRESRPDQILKRTLQLFQINVLPKGEGYLHSPFIWCFRAVKGVL